MLSLVSFVALLALANASGFGWGPMPAATIVHHAPVMHHQVVHVAQPAPIVHHLPQQVIHVQPPPRVVTAPQQVIEVHSPPRTITVERPVVHTQVQQVHVPFYRDVVHRVEQQQVHTIVHHAPAPPPPPPAVIEVHQPAPVMHVAHAVYAPMVSHATTHYGGYHSFSGAWKKA